MSFLDMLSNALSSDNVTYHNFLLNYDRNKKIIHAFFEGKTDESFYGTFIRLLKPENWRLKTYICGNKNNVFDHHEQLATKHQVHQPLLFFVDKDLDDIIPITREVSNNIYTTSYYSVENYIPVEHIVEQIWAEIFRQSSGSSSVKLVIDRFLRCLNSFHEFMIDIMAWVLLMRRQGKTLNLDSVKIKEFVYINENLELSLVYTTFEGLIKRLFDIAKITFDNAYLAEIKKCREELSAIKPKKFVRGHFELEFFVIFLRKMKSSLDTANGKKAKTHLEITIKNALDVLAPRLKIPESLELFLNFHFNLLYSI